MSSRPRQAEEELNRATEVIKRVLELLEIVLPRTAFSRGSIFDDRCPAKPEIPVLADLGQRPLVSSMEAHLENRETQIARPPVAYALLVSGYSGCISGRVAPSIGDLEAQEVPRLGSFDAPMVIATQLL
jgi:hypothetical protein